MDMYFNNQILDKVHWCHKALFLVIIFHKLLKLEVVVSDDGLSNFFVKVMEKTKILLSLNK